MTEFMKRKFSVAVGSDAYRSGWDAAFGKKKTVDTFEEKLAYLGVPFNPEFEGVHERADGTQCNYLAREVCNKCGWVETPEAVARWTKTMMVSKPMIHPELREALGKVQSLLLIHGNHEQDQHASGTFCRTCDGTLMKEIDDFLSRHA